ncbi:hypothetical protein KY290_027689 [Solanum tuberosum]|uniref:Aminotransferase-like plant mobile domain-containing protein n=1 Tax=Solanum tuberosum TaxID=4113 RepID=A0ABQ7UFV4_SOLTU|nr:hypothetical protein KY285_026663 [Solanum tuberosum]KAH0748457.1 hypothetical protein KY290_027689 [Solanum tuberosum]
MDGEKVELDYLFQRFGRLEGYDEYQHEFLCTREAWVHMRPRVFIMDFLGIMVFPIRSHSVDINILPMVISIFNNPQRFSLVPMILAEVLRSVTACIRGHDFFGCCSMLLQIWAREHFYRRDPQMDYYIGARNKIESHEDRLQNWVGASTGREEWRTFLNNLTGDAIQWKFSWIRGLTFARTQYFFFIESIGLRGIQPYAPLRVMRQFGVIQDIPLWSIMGLHEKDFTLVSLEWIRNMQAEWEYVIDLEIGEKSWCTLEYYAWLNVVSHMAHPSVRGHRGFVDNQQIDWVVEEEKEKEVLEEDLEENLEEDLEEYR